MTEQEKIDALWLEVARLTEAGELRRLSGAFARFVASLGGASPPMLLAATVLSELEGRGHSCLQLSDLAGDPAALLGWTGEQWQGLAATVAPLPKTAKAWATQITACEQVWKVGDLDYGEPLVFDGERLYLRRYWRDETVVAASIRARAATTRAVDAAKVHSWLDLLFFSQRASEKPNWQKLACAVALRGAVANSSASRRATV